MPGTQTKTRKSYSKPEEAMLNADFLMEKTGNFCSRMARHPFKGMPATRNRYRVNRSAITLTGVYPSIGTAIEDYKSSYILVQVERRVKALRPAVGGAVRVVKKFKVSAAIGKTISPLPMAVAGKGITITKTDNDKNPYATELGGPIEGQEPEFYQWEKQKWQKYLDSLSEEDRQKEMAAQDNMARKMRS
jgi:hypothetical protein